jgi:competence protein ComEC
VLGALACVQMPVLLPLWLSVPMAIAGAGGWLLRWRGRAWAAALLGLAWATVHGHWVLQASCHPARRRRMQVRGRVADLPQQGPGTRVSCCMSKMPARCHRCVASACR